VSVGTICACSCRTCRIFTSFANHGWVCLVRALVACWTWIAAWVAIWPLFALKRVRTSWTGRNTIYVVSVATSRHDHTWLLLGIRLVISLRTPSIILPRYGRTVLPCRTSVLIATLIAIIICSTIVNLSRSGSIAPVTRRTRLTNLPLCCAVSPVAIWTACRTWVYLTSLACWTISTWTSSIRWVMSVAAHCWAIRISWAVKA